MSKQATDNPEVRAVEDAAWDIKDLASELDSRSLSAPDKAVLGSVLRDLQRLTERLVAVRDKRKRGAAAAPDEQPEPQETAS